MNPGFDELAQSRRQFFGFLAKRAAMGTALSFVVSGTFLATDIGDIRSIMMRSSETWLWLGIFCFDVWVTVTGITIAIGFWGLGRGRGGQ